MSATFARSEQLRDLVFDIKLRIPEWKVLFAVDGEKDAGSIASFLEIEESDVVATLQKLQDMQLVTATQVAGEPQEAAGIDIDLPAEEEVSDDFGALDDFTAEAEPQPADESQDSQDSPEFDETDLEFPLEEEEPQEMSPATGVPDETAEAQETEAGSDDDLDAFIGNLLDDEAFGGGSDETDLESAVSEAGSDVAEAANEDFDLGNIFGDEDIAEVAEETLEETAVESPAEPFKEAAIPRKEAAPRPGGPGTILVVDDSVVIRKMVEIALENESYKIVAVATGKEALTYLDENTPDLIILDIMLSDVNGLDVLKAIKASKQIPVVMLSAKDTPRETTKAKQLGADDFIPKPFKDEELVGKIKELIKN